jgi:hypothetical protein
LIFGLSIVINYAVKYEYVCKDTSLRTPRYYSIMLCDSNTYNYGYIASRATGSNAGDCSLLAPTGRARRRLESRKYSSRNNFEANPAFRKHGFRLQLHEDCIRQYSRRRGNPVASYPQGPDVFE